MAGNVSFEDAIRGGRRRPAMAGAPPAWARSGPHGGVFVPAAPGQFRRLALMCGAGAVVLAPVLLAVRVAVSALLGIDPAQVLGDAGPAVFGQVAATTGVLALLAVVQRDDGLGLWADGVEVVRFGRSRFVPWSAITDVAVTRGLTRVLRLTGSRSKPTAPFAFPGAADPDLAAKAAFVRAWWRENRASVPTTASIDLTMPPPPPRPPAPLPPAWAAAREAARR